MKKFKHADLVSIYKEGEQMDSPLYAEQRSNLMLVNGNHYSRKGSRFWNRVRDDRGLSSDQKIRITKNHIQRICKIYENNIFSYVPSVEVMPKNENELQDQKAAELNNSVWQDIKTRKKLKERTREFIQDFVRIGEVCTKIFWDENKGKFRGYSHATDEFGAPMFDEMGKPVPDKGNPVFSGDLEIERIFGFNIFRPKEAKNMDEAPWIGHRKMVDIGELKTRVGDDEDKIKLIQESRDETYIVFDGQNSGYNESKNQCLVLEVFVRPCIQYPKGYYYIYTLNGILWEGELPFGLFPLVFCGFDEVPTQPRAHSIIKQLRPYQAEINRAGSKVAEHQITLGDDKLLIQSGTKIQNGGSLPGVRAIQYAGQPPTILEGRNGDQYINYIQAQISEMYLVANLQEDMQEKSSQQDPYSMLFASMDERKKYSIYSSKISQFLEDLCILSLSLFRQYSDDSMVIPIIGRSEFVNISEFKNSNPLNYQVRVESSTDDKETRMGKLLNYNHTIQFAGSALDKKELGRLIRTSPYVNSEQGFEDLTIDYDSATNMILSLDRGEQVSPSNYDDYKYMIQRLVGRTRKADFKQLSPQIQQNYQQVINAYEQIDAESQRKIQEAAAGYIPAQGMGVVCDIYVPDPNNSSKTMRARVPYDALTWLLKRLEEQGQTQQAIMQQQQGVAADVSSLMLSQMQQQQGLGNQGQGSQPLLNPQ